MNKQLGAAGCECLWNGGGETYACERGNKEDTNSYYVEVQESAFLIYEKENPPFVRILAMY